MNSETVDLIYLDPPFNSKRNYSAPIGSKAAGAAFKDAWTFDDADRVYLALLKERDPSMFSIIDAARLNHGTSMAAYLGMMSQRLIEMQRVLKPTGSIYLHCDPTASHYLKVLMDCVFGSKNCRNEIVWWYKGTGRPKNKFPAKHDVILFYSAGDNFNPIVIPAAKESGWTGKSEKLCDDVWEINTVYQSQERKVATGYPTQKPLPLLERIIEASSNIGDIVFDPFCGCATTAVAAERLRRNWIGIDISPKAAELVVQRLREILDEVPLETTADIIQRTDLPLRTDLGQLSHYRTHLDSLYGKQEGYCGGCGEHFRKRNLTVDHIIPRKHGGTDHLENLWLLCGACNSSKGTKSQEEFLTTRMKKRVGLFPWLVQ